MNPNYTNGSGLIQVKLGDCENQQCKNTKSVDDPKLLTLLKLVSATE